MGSEIKNPILKECDVYEGGNLSEITLSELKDNETAIKQLINSNNAKAKEVDRLHAEITQLRSESDYLKTTPFVAICFAVFNVIGTIIVGFGVNLLSSSKDGHINIWIILGGILVLLSNLGVILYRWARSWFN